MTAAPTQRYAEAVAWAVELHGSQVRKGTRIPYLTHLLAVSALLSEHGGEEDDAIAGLLHDAIEDTDATAADIEQRFGPKVAAIVLDCSDTTVRPKRPWRERKEAYQATSPIPRRAPAKVASGGHLTSPSSSRHGPRPRPGLVAFGWEAALGEQRLTKPRRPCPCRRCSAEGSKESCIREPPGASVQ